VQGVNLNNINKEKVILVNGCKGLITQCSVVETLKISKIPSFVLHRIPYMLLGATSVVFLVVFALAFTGVAVNMAILNAPRRRVSCVPGRLCIVLYRRGH
jgi:hypothetical protein